YQTMSSTQVPGPGYIVPRTETNGRTPTIAGARMMITARSTTLPTFRFLAAACALSVVAASCDNGSNDSTATATCAGIAAAAGTDQTVVLGNTVSLDGSASKLCDGGSPSFTWTFQSVPAGSQISD